MKRFLPDSFIRKNALLTALLSLLWLSAAAQRDWPSELWHEGRIVLVSGDTLKGHLKYDFQLNTLQLLVEGRQAEIFHARKILFAEIFDETVHRYRKFFSLPFTNPSNYKAPVLFELLEEGKMTLLSREMLEYKTYSSAFYAGSYTRLVQVYHYFLLQEDGSLEEFRGNRNDLLALMGDSAKDVSKYIKANRLDFDDKYDVARIVAYYNSLSRA